MPLLNAQRVPLLLLATKQDVQGSLSPGRLAVELALVGGDPALKVPFAARGCTLLKGSEHVEAAVAWAVQNALPYGAQRPRKAPVAARARRAGSDASASPEPPPRRRKPRQQIELHGYNAAERGYNVRTRV